MTVKELQELLDKLPEQAEITGINFQPDGDEFLCSMYAIHGNDTYRIRFKYKFMKFMAKFTFSAR